MGTLTFEPLVPPSLWAALAVVAAPVLAWYGWRRPGGLSRARWTAILALMTTGMALVLLILLNPTWIESVPPPAGKPRLTLLVDASASMKTADLPGSKTRFQCAAEVAGELSRRLGDQFEVQALSFAELAAPADPQNLAAISADGAQTDLAAAIQASVQEYRPQGQAIALLSDGIHNAAGGSENVLAAVRTARAMAAPVYTHTIGGDAGVRDLAVEVNTPQELAFVGQNVTVEARLIHRGLPGGRTRVALMQDGAELSRQEVTLPSEGAATARFEISRPLAGLFRYEVRADVIPGEAADGNNRAPIVLRVVDEPIRVLLLEGKPYWDGKFLMRTLAADPLAELDCVIKLTNGRLVRQSLGTERPSSSQPAVGVSSDGPGPAATRPARLQQWAILTDPAEVLAKPEALRQYQVIVLGRDAEAFLTEPGVGVLRDWVARDGGALLCFRGSPVAQISGRLAGILPVEWTSGRETRFHVKLTERGQSLRWLPGAGDVNAAASLAELPTLATAQQIGRTRPLAAVLATAVFSEGGKETPVVSFQPYGTGRAVVIEGAGMWRWAFLSPQQQEHDALYGTLWHSLLRWLAAGGGLMPGQKLSVHPDKVRFTSGEPAGATLQFRGAPAAGSPRVELVRESDGIAREVLVAAIKDEVGAYRAVLGKLEPGQYRLQVASEAAEAISGRALFEVTAPLDEQLELNARPDLMARIAGDSGGTVLTEASAAEVERRFREHTQANRPPRVRRITAWDRWWALLGMLSVWTSAWALRRSGGLI